jgi:hypothetical protein
VVPVSSVVGTLSWHDDDVTFPAADLVVAARAAVGLRGFVRLDAPYVKPVVGVVGEIVVRHGDRSAEHRPRDEPGDDGERGRDQRDIAAVTDPPSERIEAHDATVAGWNRSSSPATARVS